MGRPGIPRGQKLFELSDHLGNVLVTISDKKIGLDNNTDYYVDYYEPDVMTANDYYPFGMGVVGRKFASQFDYRFGFGAQEKSKEIRSDGNSYTAEYWEYDPRIGRRWNIDPHLKQSESSYSSFANNPIFFIDPYGLDTSKYLSNEQLVSAIRIAHRIVADDVKNNQFNASKNKEKEINDAIENYWKENKSEYSWDALVEFKEQVNEHFKGFKEVAFTSSSGLNHLAEVLDYVGSTNKEKIEMVQMQLEIYNGSGGSIAGSGIAALGIVLGVGTSPTNVSLGARGPFFSNIKNPEIPKSNIQFGANSNQIYHAFRHTDKLGLDRMTVKSAIEAHFKTISNKIETGKALNQIVQVGDHRIQYTAYKLSNGTINIGRIHGVK